MKRQLTEQEKILANDMTDKGLISKIYKQLIQLNNNNKNPNPKMGRRSKQTFLQKEIKTSEGTWKDAQYCWLLEKCKWKPQWGTTSYQSEWPSLRILQINAGKHVEKREPFHTVGGNVSWYNHYGKQHGGSCKTELAYNPAVPLLGIYPDKTVIQNDTCTPMFMVKTWKQAKCPSTDECIKKMGYIHTTDYYWAIKKNEMMPSAATRMQLKLSY